MRSQTHTRRIVEAILNEGAKTATDFSHVSNANQFFCKLEEAGILESYWGKKGSAKVKYRRIKDREKALSFLGGSAKSTSNIIAKKPTDLRELRAVIKERLDRETVIELLSFIGYTISRDYKFSIREERTPSASIAPDGYIKDFGDGWGGDIVALLHERHGQSLKDAIFYVCGCLKISYE